MSSTSGRSPAGLDFTKTIHNDTYPFIDPSKLDLSGKSILITGASKGVGRATAVSLARAGASQIAISARSDLTSVEEEIAIAAKAAGRKQPSVLSIKLDVTDQAAVDAAVEKVTKDFGRLDILMNNAGFLEKWAPITKGSSSEWWNSWEVNLKGTYLCSKAFIPLLLSSSGGDKIILNISSIGAHFLMHGASAYQTAKLALCRFTEFLASDYKDEGLLAYCAHPGGIRTELGLNMPTEIHAALTDTAEMAGDTFAWLLSEKPEWLVARYISCTWDMEELLGMRDEIVNQDLLKIRMAV